MNSSKERLILGGAVILVLVVAGFVFWRWRPANNANHPDGIAFICQNAQCKNEFVMTIRDYDDYKSKHYGESMACPKCGQRGALRATVCPSCKRIFVRDRGNPACPFCQKEIE